MSQHQNPKEDLSTAANSRSVAENFALWFGESKAVDQEGKPLVLHHSTYGDFDAFERTSDVGFHFGSAAVAMDRVTESSTGRGRGDDRYAGLNIRQVYLSIANPVHLPDDPRSWNPVYVTKLLTDMSIVSDREKEAIWALDELATKDARAEAAELKEANGPGLIRRKQPWPGGLVFVELQTKVWRRMLEKHQQKAGVHKAIVDCLRQKGFDGITYMNEFEGEGRGRRGRRQNQDNLCWVAFEASQIKSVHNSGLYLRDSPSTTDLEASKALLKAKAALRSIPELKRPQRALIAA